MLTTVPIQPEDFQMNVTAVHNFCLFYRLLKCSLSVEKAIESELESQQE